jgi:type III pantothenate kinase
MWLGIDAGNTNLVLGVFSDQSPRPLRTFRLSTNPIGTPDELRMRIRGVLSLTEGTRLDDHTPIVLASVVPAFTRVARHAYPELKVIDSSWGFSFRIQTENPAQTGIDRLVNAEAVVRQYGPEPALIVDSGTTTTICALGQEGAFLGGAILPGLKSCRDVLPAKAAQLFTVDLIPPAQAIGRGTDSALRSGVMLGYASMIEGMIERFKRELAATGALRPRVVVTGGTSRMLRELCPSLASPEAELDPDLTLKGIAYLYESATRR